MRSFQRLSSVALALLIGLAVAAPPAAAHDVTLTLTKHKKGLAGVKVKAALSVHQGSNHNTATRVQWCPAKQSVANTWEKQNGWHPPDLNVWSLSNQGVCDGTIASLIDLPSSGVVPQWLTPSPDKYVLRFEFDGDVREGVWHDDPGRYHTDVLFKAVQVVCTLKWISPTARKETCELDL